MASRSTDNTLERQNDAELENLHGKIKSLRSVTIDILDDSQRQNEQLDRTSNTFSQFTNSLLSTTRHQARTFSQSSGKQQIRTIGYIVAVVLVLWFGGKWWFSGSSATSSAGGITGEV